MHVSQKVTGTKYDTDYTANMTGEQIQNRTYRSGRLLGVFPARVGSP